VARWKSPWRESPGAFFMITPSCLIVTG